MYRAETRQTNLCCFCHIYTSLLSVFQLNVKCHNKANISTLVVVGVGVVLMVEVTIGADWARAAPAS